MLWKRAAYRGALTWISENNNYIKITFRSSVDDNYEYIMTQCLFSFI